MDPDPSLRERKKEQTRRQLTAAAYDVIRDHGMTALSADAVAQRAGVSRRTFFNYFPTVESVVVPIVTELLERVDDELAERTVDASIMASLARIVREHDDPALIERFTVIGLMAQASPAHHGLMHECAHEWIDGFVTSLPERIGRPVDELYAYGVATALIGAADASLRVWLGRTGGEITPDTIALRQQLLAEAIDRLGAGFDPPGAP